jgi:hypothetical protein
MYKYDIFLHSNLMISAESILRKVQLRYDLYSCVFCRMIPVCMNTREHHVWPTIPFGERNLDVSSDPLTQTRLPTFANATHFQIILLQISHYW